MARKVALALALAWLPGLWFLACSGSGSSTTSSSSTASSSSSTGTTGTTGTSASTDISVTGVASVHPVAVTLYTAAGGNLLTGTAPALANLDFRVDEPLLVITHDPHARLGDTTLDAAGNFSLPSIDTDYVTVGLVGTIGSPSPDGGDDACEQAVSPTTSTSTSTSSTSGSSGSTGSTTSTTSTSTGSTGSTTGSNLPSYCDSFVTSATGLYEGKPQPGQNITNAKAYGVPVQFEELLSSQLGFTTVGSRLIDVGFVLGYVVDAQGNPLAGVKLDVSRNANAPDVRYFDDNFVPIAAADTAHQMTNKYGIFVVVAPGNPLNFPHTFGIVGHSEFGCHQLGSNPGSVFNLIYDASSAGVCK